MSRAYALGICVVLAVLAAGCQRQAPERPAESKPSAPDLAALQLPAQPAGAVSVLDARKGGPAERAVVSGRVASLVGGYVAFTLMDKSLPYCGETNKEDSCKTPWDYCCESGETRTAHSLVVEARGADGKPLRAQGDVGLRLLDAVTVTGKLSKDEHGNHVLVATGWHRDERPSLPADVRWPR